MKTRGKIKGNREGKIDKKGGKERKTEKEQLGREGMGRK